jgi:hypothetical protein
MDPADERTLAAALAYLDGVHTDDEDFWPRILDALRRVDDAQRLGDPALVRAAIKDLYRGLTHRAIPIGSASKEPIPDAVRELRAVIQHRLDADSGAEQDGKLGAAERRPPGREKR